MPIDNPGPCANEELPVSQRITLPTPPPRRRVRPRRPGEYRMIDGQPEEQPEGNR